MVLFFLLVTLLFRSPSDNLKCCRGSSAERGAEGGSRCRLSRGAAGRVFGGKSTEHCRGCLWADAPVTGLCTGWLRKARRAEVLRPALCPLGAVAQDSLLRRCDWGTGSLHGRKTTCERFLCFLQTVSVPSGVRAGASQPLELSRHRSAQAAWGLTSEKGITAQMQDNAPTGKTHPPTIHPTRG